MNDYSTNDFTTNFFNDKERIAKIQRTLDKIEDVLNQNGLGNYQERMHRITKTVKSIEKHSNCYVSDFNIGGTKNDFHLKEMYDQTFSNKNDYMTVNENTVEFNDAENEKKLKINMSLEKLLEFIETELDINAISNNIKECKELSDDEDGSTDLENNNEVKKNEKDEKKVIRKKFFKIELQLRAFLKQEKMKSELFKDFETFSTEILNNTPTTKEIKPTPSFIKNFFEETLPDLEKIKTKRISVINDKSLKTLMGIGDVKLNENKIVNQSEKPKDFRPSNNGKKISDFNFEPIKEDFDENIKNTPNDQFKRTSIFRNPYIFDEKGEYLADDIDNQPIYDKDDIVSEKSEENIDSDSEYEEIEVEEEVEIEVEEKVKKNK